MDTGVLSPGIKLPGRELVHSPPTSAEVKNTWNYTSTLLYVSWGGDWLNTGTTVLYFTLLYFTLL